MKHLLLIASGILIAFMFLEGALQTASFVINQTDKHMALIKYKKLKQKDAITIMCVGESTTYKQYPIKLEKYLENNSTKKFIIIESAIPGASIENLLQKTNILIEQYHPDIVISMMGINNIDYFETKNDAVYKKYKLKTVELIILIKKHIMHLPFVSRAFAENTNNTEYYSKLFEEYFESGKEPEKLLEIIQKNPKDSQALHTLVNLYFSRSEFSKVKKYAQIYLNDKTNPQNIDILFELAVTHVYFKEFDSFLELTQEILNNKNLDNESKKYFLQMTVPIDIGKSDKELIQYYNMLVKNKVTEDIVDKLYNLALYKNLDVKKYDYTLDKQKNLEFKEEVKEYYVNFAEKLIKQNIIYLCMSYPTMPIETFKSFFNGTNFKNKIIFVSNEHNFKDKLKVLPYYELFADSFARTFGHCTAYGNELIAENAGNIIVNLTK